jgi:ubiquinone/menaquinone biosynthesis C-methylase UbiE
MKSLTDTLFVRHEHVCPWYFCFTFDNSLRRWAQNPEKIIRPFVKPGNTIVDIGPGQGYFTIPMSQMAGPQGTVFAVDIQQEMLDRLHGRAAAAGVADRIMCIKISDEAFTIPCQADFILAFWMVHEVKNKEIFFNTLWTILKPGGKILIAEPYLHVSESMMEYTIKIAVHRGFMIIDQPEYFFTRSYVLRKPDRI